MMAFIVFFLPACFPLPPILHLCRLKAWVKLTKILPLVEISGLADDSHLQHCRSRTCRAPEAAPNKSREENKQQRTVRELLRVVIERGETFLTTQEQHKGFFGLVCAEA